MSLGIEEPVFHIDPTGLVEADRGDIKETNKGYDDKNGRSYAIILVRPILVYDRPE